MRTLVMWSGLLAFGLVVALSLPTTMRSGTAPPEAAKPEPVLTAENAVELCQQLFEELKVAYARNLPYERKAEAVAMLREAKD